MMEYTRNGEIFIMSFGSPEKIQKGNTEGKTLKNKDALKTPFEREVEAGIERINNDLEKIVLKLRKEGCDLEDNGRIDFFAFKDYYSSKKIEDDRKKVEKLEKQWEEKEKCLNRYSTIEKDGELLEKYLFVIFNEFLGEKFLGLRTSRLDDYENHVDILLIDRETSIPFCTVDSVGDTSGPRHEEKKKKVEEINQRGGAHVDYGYQIKNRKISRCGLSNLPLFLLSSDHTSIMDYYRNDSNDMRKIALDSFLYSIKKQIKKLEEDKNIVNKKFLEKLKIINGRLEELSKK